MSTAELGTVAEGKTVPKRTKIWVCFREAPGAKEWPTDEQGKAPFGSPESQTGKGWIQLPDTDTARLRAFYDIKGKMTEEAKAGNQVHNIAFFNSKKQQFQFLYIWDPKKEKFTCKRRRDMSRKDKRKSLLQSLKSDLSTAQSSDPVVPMEPNSFQQSGTTES